MEEGNPIVEKQQCEKFKVGAKSYTKYTQGKFDFKNGSGQVNNNTEERPQGGDFFQKKQQYSKTYNQNKGQYYQSRNEGGGGEFYQKRSYSPGGGQSPNGGGNNGYKGKWQNNNWQGKGNWNNNGGGGGENGGWKRKEWLPREEWLKKIAMEKNGMKYERPKSMEKKPSCSKQDGEGATKFYKIKAERVQEDDENEEEYGEEDGAVANARFDSTPQIFKDLDKRQQSMQSPVGKEFDDDDMPNSTENPGKQQKYWNQFAVNHRAQNLIQYREKQIQQHQNSMDNEDQGFNKMHAFQFGINKAGMDGKNDDRMQEILKSSISNQQYYITQETKIKDTENKISKYLKKIEQYKKSGNLWNKTQAEVKHRLDVYRKERVLTRTWLHVDMDMFYAACEIRDRPELREKPVAVGDYSMIQTTNYVARKFGVRSAMPGFMGKKLCPHLVFVKSDKEKYKRISDNEFKVILREYDPHLESIGLDEANMDITEFLVKNDLDQPQGRIFVAEKIRKAIREQMQMTSSVGIACNKMLAKICSEQNKPDGYSYLTFDAEKIEDFMRMKKVRDIPGVGKVQEQILIGLGITSVTDILQRAADIYINFTETAFEFLIKAAMGISRCVHEEDTGLISKRSISFSKSFRPISRLDQFHEKLKLLSEKLGDKCWELRVLARTLSIEFRSDKFQNSQKSISFNVYISHKDDIYKYSTELLATVWPMPEPVRTISLKLNNLRYRTAKDPEGPQLTSKEDRLKFFSGKGRKKGCLTNDQGILQAEQALNDDLKEGQQSEHEDETDEECKEEDQEPQHKSSGSICNVSGNFAFVTQSGLSAAQQMKKKEKEERYKRLIGQTDIKNFFGKKPQQSEQQNQGNSVQNDQAAQKEQEQLCSNIEANDQESFEQGFKEIEESPDSLLARRKNKLLQDSKPKQPQPIVDEHGNELIEEEESEVEDEDDRFCGNDEYAENYHEEEEIEEDESSDEVDENEGKIDQVSNPEEKIQSNPRKDNNRKPPQELYGPPSKRLRAI